MATSVAHDRSFDFDIAVAQTKPLFATLDTQEVPIHIIKGTNGHHDLTPISEEEGEVSSVLPLRRVLVGAPVLGFVVWKKKLSFCKEGTVLGEWRG